MKVRRIETGRGSHIEPRLQDDWSELAKLRWHAAVVVLDSGTDARVLVEPSVSKWKPKWSPFWFSEDSFQITVGNSTAFPFTFDSAWIYLNGVGSGLSAGSGAGDDRP